MTTTTPPPPPPPRSAHADSHSLFELRVPRDPWETERARPPSPSAPRSSWRATPPPLAAAGCLEPSLLILPLSPSLPFPSPPLPTLCNQQVPAAFPPRPSAHVSAAHFDHCSCLSISLNSYLLFFLFLFYVFFLSLPSPRRPRRRLSHGRAARFDFQTSVASRFSCLLMYGSVNKPAKMKMGISVVSGSLE